MATLPEVFEGLVADIRDAGLNKSTGWVRIVWETVRPDDFPNYTAGNWGPEASVSCARTGDSG